jgi:hypothetical protein
MYVQRNSEALSCNHRCGGKAIYIAYSEIVFTALGILHAMRMRNVTICALPGFTVFSHLIS